MRPIFSHQITSKKQIELCESVNWVLTKVGYTDDISTHKWVSPLSLGLSSVKGVYYTSKVRVELYKLYVCVLKKFHSYLHIHSVSFISNALNFQPVSNLRFSIVVACVCCLVSKKNSCLLLIFQENNGFSKKKQNFWPVYLVKK